MSTKDYVGLLSMKFLMIILIVVIFVSPIFRPFILNYFDRFFHEKNHIERMQALSELYRYNRPEDMTKAFELGRIEALSAYKKEFWFDMGIIAIVVTILSLLIAFVFIPGYVESRVNSKVEMEVRHEIEKISNELKSMIDVYPVIEHEFYKIKKFNLNSEVINDNNVKENIKNHLKSICTFSVVNFHVTPYLVNERERKVYVFYNPESIIDHYDTGYTSDSINNETISVLKGIDSLKYFVEIGLRNGDKELNGKEEEIRKKIISIISNMKGSFIIKTYLKVNNELIWDNKREVKINSRFRPNTEIELHGISENNSIYFEYLEFTKVNVESDFIDTKDIEKRYRDELIKRK